MTVQSAIPIWQLFGETAPFPDIAHCERIKDRAPRHGWRIEPHRHAHMAQAVQVLSGAATVTLDAQRHTLFPGDVAFVPAQVVHAFRFEDSTEGRVLSFPLPLLQPLAEASPTLAASLAQPFCAALPRTATDLFAAFDAVHSSNGTYRAQSLVALAQSVLCAVAELRPPQEDSAPDSDPPLLRRFDAQVQAHLADGWQPGDHAAALGITAGHLSRLCRDARGMGARACIDAAAMTEACRLLAFTRLPVSEIGYLVGYEDPSHFSRRFRALRGQSPGDYRRRFFSAPRAAR